MIQPEGIKKDKDTVDENVHTKQAYSSPKLVKYGSIASLTLGAGSSGGDGKSTNGFG